MKLKPKRRTGAEITNALGNGDKAVARIRTKLTDGSGNSATERLKVRLKR